MYNGLSPKQLTFARRYLVNGFNSKEAARHAKYSESVVNVADKILHKPKVQEYLKPFLEEYELRQREKDAKTQDLFGWKVDKLKRVANEFINDDDELVVEKVKVGINAISELNRMQGDIAPTKSQNVNVSVALDEDRAKALMNKLTLEHKKDY